MKLTAIATLLLGTCLAHAGEIVLKDEQIKYSITGKEAADLFASFTKETGAYTTRDGAREVIRLEYNQAGAANIRIRTRITCYEIEKLCKVGVSHMAFIPYKGD